MEKPCEKTEEDAVVGNKIWQGVAFSYILSTIYCAKTQKDIDFLWTWYYHRTIKTRAEALMPQRQFCQALELNREWGKAMPKPRMNQYRVRWGKCPLAKASHWEQSWEGRAWICLRRESGNLLNRQNVAWEWLWWCSISLEHRHNLFVLIE